MVRTRCLSSRFCGSVFFAALLWASAVSAQQPGDQRLFRVDDLFELEGVGRYYGGPYAFSQDEQRLAFTRIRPKKTLANFKWEYLWSNAGADVWVQTSPAAQPVNVTNGAEDGSGWWSPQWSPDGQTLAMVSTRGGNVCLWVWDSASEELRQLTTRNVELAEVRERPYLWVDNRHILVPVMPEGEKPLGMIAEIRTPTIASAAWPKAQSGDEVTASVLRSGVPVDLTERPQGDLLLVDITDGSHEVVVRGTTQRWQLSPNRTAVAFTRRHTPYLPKADEPLPFGSAAAGLSSVSVVALDGTPITLSGETSQDVLIESLRWSPDGDEIAFFGYAEDRTGPPRLYIVSMPDGVVNSLVLRGIDVAPLIREEAQIEWTGDERILVRATEHIPGTEPDATTRWDWWLVDRTGKIEKLTSDLDEPPSQLWPQQDRSAFVGVGGDELWRIDAGAGQVENLTAQFEAPVSSLVWPAMTNRGIDEYRVPGRTYEQAIFSVQEGVVVAPYVVDLDTREIQAIAKPVSNAELVGYAPTTETAIFYVSDRHGLRVWRARDRGTEPTLLFEANAFLQGIAEGEFRQIQYTSLDGEPLKGWLILPPAYEEGKRYPLLTWVYAGSVYGDRLPSGATSSISGSISLNKQIPAAHGYVVLLPSMPLEPESVTQDPMWQLTNGVLPAVDEAIEMGIADPDRLFVMGQSFGGFATYGLITQTHRFTAAVALAGLSNLISLYGQFDARYRYTDYPHENLFQASLSEGGQIAMGSPPWNDLGRYIRNSPIFAVDRVRTPIMIIQGDMDYVALQQGEEFFFSLYRQGKRAEFVRYWGEGHVLESPANIRDMWSRIFAWFDEFSPSPDAAQPDGPQEDVP